MSIRETIVKNAKSMPVVSKAFRYFHFHSLLEDSLKGCESVLDLGCGGDSPFAPFSKNFYSVGVDAFLPSIEESKKLGVHNEYFHMDVLEIDKHFADKSFDCVLLTDLIEHLEKQDGELLIGKMEKIAKKRIVIFTPNGFLSQGVHYDNPWQIHKSGWTASEMASRGYRVIGIGGFKFLRTELSHIKYRPRLFWLAISGLSQLIVRNYPRLAFSILCVKEKN